MKLYYYEHCPFSARVRMALYLKNREAQPIVLLADDEKTLATLVGKHQIPVLIDDEGTPRLESMAVVRYLDDLDGQPLIERSSTQAVDSWLEPVVPLIQYLGYPRWTRIGLAEFSTPAAYEHFRKKKSESIGDFGEAVANTERKAAEVSDHLRRLPGRVDLAGDRDRLTMTDIALGSMLRSLSVVAAVEWPDAVRRYTTTLTARTGIDTFFDRAL